MQAAHLVRVPVTGARLVSLTVSVSPYVTNEVKGLGNSGGKLLLRIPKRCIVITVRYGSKSDRDLCELGQLKGIELMT